MVGADGLIVVNDDMHVTKVSHWVASTCAPADALTGGGIAARLRTLAISLAVTQVSAEHPDRVVIHELTTPDGARLFQFQIIDTDDSAHSGDTTVGVSDITRLATPTTPHRWTVICALNGSVIGSDGPCDDHLPVGENIMGWLDPELSGGLSDPAEWWGEVVAGKLTEAAPVPVRRNGEPARTASVRAICIGDQVIVDAALESVTPERFTRSGEEVMVVGASGEVTWASPGFVAILDRTMDALVGAVWTDFVVADDHHLVLAPEALVPASRTDQTRVPLLFRVARPDGEIRTLEGARVDLRDDPAVNGTLVSCRDVTERVAADLRVRRSERRVEAIMNASRGAVVTFDGPRLTWANAALEKLVGAPREVYMQRGFVESVVTDPDDLSALSAVTAAALVEPGVEHLFEVDIVRADNGQRRRVAGQITSWMHDPEIGEVVVNCRDITELANNAAVLAAAEAKFRTIVDAVSDDPILILDADTFSVMMTNVACREMFPNWEKFDHQLLEVYPDDRRLVASLLADAKADPKAPVRATFRLCADDDGIRHVRSVFADFSADANIGGIILVLSDITAIVEADTLVSLEAERWRLLLAHATEALVVFDVSGTKVTVSYASDAVASLIGVSVEEFINDPVAVFHPDDIPAAADAIARASEVDSPVMFSCRLSHPVEGWQWVEAIIRDLRDVEHVAGLVVNVRNISEIVRSRDAATNLAARYESVVAHLAEGLILVDEDGMITEANQAAMAIFEMPVSDVVGVDVWDADPRLSDPVTGAAVTGANIPGLHTLVTGEAVTGSELAYVTPGGAHKIIRVHTSTFGDLTTNENGAVIGVADVTVEFGVRRQLEALISTVSALNAELQTVIAVSAAERDRERQRIALGLHDDAIQMIVAARWKVDELASESDDAATRAAVVTGVSDLLEQTVAALRAIILDLRPPALDDLGLYGAVCDFVERLDGGVVWTCEDRDDRLGRSSAVPQDAQSLIWRTVCEAARNVERHAKATSASIRFDVLPHRIVCIIQDDGVGATDAELQEAASLGHIGVVSMRETIQAAGGSFSATMGAASSTRPGWRVQFSIPFNGRSLATIPSIQL